MRELAIQKMKEAIASWVLAWIVFDKDERAKVQKYLRSLADSFDS